MLHNIDMNQLNTIRERDPEAGQIIDTLLSNHKRVISTISHEIRNPLALVYSSLQLIESKNPEVQDLKFWNSTMEEVELMKQLLEELSTFNNAYTLKYETFDSTVFLKQVALSFAASVDRSDIEFISEISPLLPKITVDKVKLQEVFLNILCNAQDAIPDAGTIHMRAITKDSNILVTISDTGIGIPPVYLSTIFDMFQTYKSNGTGLGLSIAKRIVEAHHGTITVESTVDVGTTFFISLPIQQSTQEYPNY